MRRIVCEYIAKGSKAPRRLAEAASSRHRLYWRQEPPKGEIKDALLGVVQLLADQLGRPQAAQSSPGATVRREDLNLIIKCSSPRI